MSGRHSPGCTGATSFFRNRTYIRFNHLDSSLSANSNQFHFDYQNGKYGYNTDPNRGADTFHPFSNGNGFFAYSDASTASQIVTFDTGNPDINTFCIIHSSSGMQSFVVGKNESRNAFLFASNVAYQGSTFTGVGKTDPVNIDAYVENGIITVYLPQTYVPKGFYVFAGVS